MTAWVSAGLCLLGAFFYLSGTIGMLRFPDALTRLHALTKADSMGLGLVVAGLLLQAESFPVVLKLLLVWFLALLAGANACYLLARHTIRRGSGASTP